MSVAIENDTPAQNFCGEEMDNGHPCLYPKGHKWDCTLGPGHPKSGTLPYELAFLPEKEISPLTPENGVRCEKCNGMGFRPSKDQLVAAMRGASSEAVAPLVGISASYLRAARAGLRPFTWNVFDRVATLFTYKIGPTRPRGGF